MRLKYLFHITTLSLFILILGCGIPKKSIKKPNGNQKQTSVRLPDVREASTPLMIGYNAPGIFFQFRNGKPPKEIIGLYRNLNADIIRFPGGTLANHYRFSKPGYGRDKAADKKHSQNFIFEFIRLMKNISDQPRGHICDEFLRTLWEKSGWRGKTNQTTT